MARLSASAEFDVPAGVVWGLLADFGDLEAWWPAEGRVRIEELRCEGEGVGMVRHIRNAGAEKPVSERLDLLDPDAMTLILSIIGDRPAGLTAYVATGTVVALDAARCRLDYCAQLTTVPGQEQRAEKMIRATWELMFAGLRSAAARRCG